MAVFEAVKNPINKPVIHKSAREKTADMLYRLFRVLVIFNAGIIFLPQLNPARISSEMNSNLSLFTGSISIDRITSNIGRIMNTPAVEKGFEILRMNCLIIVAGVILCAVFGCLSLGNNKLKKIGLVFSFTGGGLQLYGLLGVRQLLHEFVRLSNEGIRINPANPPAYELFVVLAALTVLLSVAAFVVTPNPQKGEKAHIEPKFQLFLMLLPVIVLSFVFSYLPLYGWRYAFYNVRAGEPLTSDNFAGFTWFTALFQNAATRADILRVLKNTFAMSGLGLLTSWVPLAFAVFLSEIRNSRFRRIVQTITTIPNFISWVLVYAIAFAIFSLDGFVNTYLSSIGPHTSVDYLADPNNMWLKMLAWGMWKGLGWSAIIYIAAISGIDQSLYEAATVDGAGRFAKMRYITIPDLMPTFFVLLLLSIAGILSNGLEQYLVFTNPANRSSLQVLDLYVYQIGIEQGTQLPLSTVVGMTKSIVSVALLFGANSLSKAIRGQSII